MPVVAVFLGVGERSFVVNQGADGNFGNNAAERFAARTGAGSLFRTAGPQRPRFRRHPRHRFGLRLRCRRGGRNGADLRSGRRAHRHGGINRLGHPPCGRLSRAGLVPLFGRTRGKGMGFAHQNSDVVPGRRTIRLRTGNSHHAEPQGPAQSLELIIQNSPSLAHRTPISAFPVSGHIHSIQPR